MDIRTKLSNAIALLDEGKVRQAAELLREVRADLDKAFRELAEIARQMRTL